MEDILVTDFKKIAQELINLFEAKQHDYGPGNIASFGNLGVLVRMNDKFERLKNLVLNNKRPANEGIEDTLKDIANYAVIYLMIERGLWPEAKEFSIKEVKHIGEEEKNERTSN